MNFEKNALKYVANPLKSLGVMQKPCDNLMGFRNCIEVICTSLLCLIWDTYVDPYLLLWMHSAQIKQYFILYSLFDPSLPRSDT